MAVFVDDVRHPFRGMIMCHMWADSLAELLEMADWIGLNRKWLQEPPKASWQHFDISIGKKREAIRNGAILTDRLAPLEHVARMRGDTRLLERVAALRQRHGASSSKQAPVSPDPQGPGQLDCPDLFTQQRHEGV